MKQLQGFATVTGRVLLCVIFFIIANGPGPMSIISLKQA
jgi:hypothetical protein